MKKQFFYIFSFVLIALAIACKQNNATTNTATAEVKGNAELEKILNDYFNDRMKVFPFEATGNGVNDYNDQFPIDISDAYQDTIQQLYDKYDALVAKLDPTKLSDNDRTSVEILKWEAQNFKDGRKFHFNYMPINQFWSLTLSLGQLASGDGSQPFKTVKDYDNWLKRMSNFSAWGDTAIANMKKGIAMNMVLPTSLVNKVLPQLSGVVQADFQKSLFYAPVGKFPKDFSEADRNRLTVAYAEMVKKVVNPTYQKLYDFMKKEYLPKSRSTSGINAFANGKEMYQYLIKTWTTTDMTADEVFALGEKEVARIRGEMEKVKEQVGFKGDLKAFFKYVTDENKALRPFKTVDDVLGDFNKIHDRMKPQLEKLFDLKPKTPFEVRRTEEFREASASAEYNQGSPDGTRPGIFYYPIVKGDATKDNNFQHEALFLHEAIPGHHYQISIQQENEAIPKFRRFLWYGAYGEGWALYTESLGKELGLYTDPYQYFGRLGMEMHRAIRLVVDAGMHSKGWTREKAIAYNLDNEAETVEGVTAEIERYMAIPGQALGYKVGQIKIAELRAKAEKAKGDKFDIRKFHNTVLIDGCLPLNILERKVDKMLQ